MEDKKSRVKKDGRILRRKAQNTLKRIHKRSKEKILRCVYAKSPTFFEHLAVEIVQFGSGGSKGEVIPSRGIPGQSGDGGVDGMIEFNDRGKEKIYIQAKRYAPKHKVARKEVRDFIRALDKKNEKRGTLITTSDFTKPARESAEQSHLKIALMNGQELAEWIARYGAEHPEKPILRIKKS